MDLNIIKKQDNPLLSRAEIELEASFFNEATPKKENIKKSIASIQKADEKLVVVKHVYSDFGDGKAKVLAYIYKSEDELKKIEPKKKKAKPEEGVPKEEGKEEEKEAPKEEAKKKAEEPSKEEPKKEIKKE